MLNNNATIVREHVVDFYNGIFSEHEDVGVVDDVLVPQIIPSLVSAADNDFFLDVLSNSEVKYIAFVLDDGSVQGPSDFFGLFFIIRNGTLLVWRSSRWFNFSLLLVLLSRVLTLIL